MKVEYIAYDGKRFDTESECKRYEYEKGFHVSMFDGGCQYTELLENAVYIVVNSLDEIELLRDIARKQKQTIDGIDGVGFWIWDDYCGEYTTFGYLKFRLDNLEETTKEAKKDYKIIFGKEYKENED